MVALTYTAFAEGKHSQTIEENEKYMIKNTIQINYRNINCNDIFLIF